MLESRRLLRVEIVVLLVGGLACATTSNKSATDSARATDYAVKAAAEKKATPGTPGADEDVLAIDTNGDNKPDVFKYFPKGKVPTDITKPETGGPLLRAERDLNGDGKVDVWTWYNPDGTKLRESFDLDFDGKVDLVVFYEKTQVVRTEYYTTGRDKPDVYKYYDKGSSSASNGTGKEPVRSTRGSTGTAIKSTVSARTTTETAPSTAGSSLPGKPEQSGLRGGQSPSQAKHH